MNRTTLGLFLSLLATPALALEEQDTAASPPGPRVGVTFSVIPAGIGGRLLVPAASGLEVFVGASAAAAVFTWDTTPTRLRGELGALYYPTQQIGRGLYLGVQGAGAYWTEAPLLGGSNVSFGPTIGGSAPVGDHGGALMAGVGMQAHFYSSDYQTIGSGDAFAVWPQLDVVVVLPHAR